MPKINTNIQAMFTATALRRTERSLTGTLEKLSTGNAINRSSDNASGLSISEQLRMQTNGLAAGNRNINHGVSLLNVAEGALVEIQNMLQRVRELAIQSSTATLADEERAFIQREVSELVNEMERITAVTQYNKRTLLNGDSKGQRGDPTYNPWGDVLGEGGIIHIGPNNTTEGDASDLIKIRMLDAKPQTLGLKDPMTGDPIDLSTAINAQAAISVLDVAIEKVSAFRSQIGSYVNRLEHAFASQLTASQNVAAAESYIRHTDVAVEMSEFTRLQIMQQASTAMLAQANSFPNNILGLLNSR